MENSVQGYPEIPGGLWMLWDPERKEWAMGLDADMMSTAGFMCYMSEASANDAAEDHLEARGVEFIPVRVKP